MMKKRPDLMIIILLIIWVIALISAYYNNFWYGVATTVLPILFMAMISRHNVKNKNNSSTSDKLT